jgi:hypothetical protein
MPQTRRRDLGLSVGVGIQYGNELNERLQRSS